MISKIIRFPFQLSTNFCQRQSRLSYTSKAFIVNHNVNNSQSKIKKQYIPLRPLKKQLTTLFVNKDFINKRQVPQKPKLLPHLLPAFGLFIHNILAGWTLIGSAGMMIAFVFGYCVKLFRGAYLDRSTMKLQCNKQMSKYYIEIVQGFYSSHIRQAYQQNIADIFPQQINISEDPQQFKKQQDLDAKQLQTAQKKLSQKKWNQILNVLFQQYQTSRFQLDASKTEFILSSNYQHQISQNETYIGTQQLKKIDKILTHSLQPFLIVKTQFKASNGKNINLTIKLDENAQLKYEDYLYSLGQGYKIKAQM